MRRRRAKKRVLPKINQHAMRQVYRAAFGEPMPKGWDVVWVGFMRGALGLCCYGERSIKLSFGDLGKGEHRRDRQTPLEVLIHEFVHVRCRGLRHGEEFDRLVRLACEEIGVPVRGHFEGKRFKAVRREAA